MNADILREYRRDRKPTYAHFHIYQTTAQIALRNARTRVEWRNAEWDEFSEPAYGDVRLLVKPDDSYSLDDLFGDTFNPDVNDNIPASRLAREKLAEEERVNRDGVWGIITEYFDGEKWVHADSCWGFVGTDWEESGYDIDLMRAALDASQQLRDAREYKAPYPSTWKEPIGELMPYSNGWHVLGYCCLVDDPMPEKHFAPVYYVNIGPLYSQHCARCGRELVHGASGVELFDGKR